MNEQSDISNDIYDPIATMARVGHLPVQAQQEIEQISRIVRAAFGYGEGGMPEQGRIVLIALTNPYAICPSSGDIAGYDFHITVNLSECVDDAHWCLVRRLIAAEIPHRTVTLTVTVEDCPSGIVLYDAEADLPLNMRELSVRP